MEETLKVNEFTMKINSGEMKLDKETDIITWYKENNVSKTYSYKTDMSKYETVFTEITL